MPLRPALVCGGGLFFNSKYTSMFTVQKIKEAIEGLNDDEVLFLESIDWVDDKAIVIVDGELALCKLTDYSEN